MKPTKPDRLFVVFLRGPEYPDALNVLAIGDQRVAACVFDAAVSALAKRNGTPTAPVGGAI